MVKVKAVVQKWASNKAKRPLQPLRLGALACRGVQQLQVQHS